MNRKRLGPTCGLLLAAWLLADGRASAETHLTFTGSINGVSWEDLGFEKDIWLSPENARWNDANLSVIINYGLDRLLVLFHARKTYLETRWSTGFEEVLPPSSRTDPASAAGLDFETAGSETECEAGTQAIWVEEDRRQIMCLVDRLPGVDIERVLDLQTTQLRIAGMPGTTARSRAGQGGMIVRAILETRLGYQDTRVVIDLDSDSIREVAPPWNLFGIPVGYERAVRLESTELANFSQGPTEPTAPSECGTSRRGRRCCAFPAMRGR